MDPLSAGIIAGGGLAGGVIDFAGGMFQAHKAEEAAAEAYARKIHWAKKGPGYTMQGLKAAGLNPILAAGGGLGSGGGSMPQAQAINPAQGSAQAGAQVAGAIASAREATARAKSAEAQSDLDSVFSAEMIGSPIRRSIYEGTRLGLKDKELAIYVGFRSVDAMLEALREEGKQLQNSAQDNPDPEYVNILPGVSVKKAPPRRSSRKPTNSKYKTY